MTEQPDTQQKLSVDFAYGFMALPLAVLGVPLYLYLPSYLFENWHISLATIGWVLMLARLSDVITDPLIGYLSDRRSHNRSRYGFILLGAAILLPAIYLLFMPLESLLQAYPISYLLLSTLAAFFGWTLMNVPYQAMVAELVKDGSSQAYLKTRLTVFREAFVILGVVLALAAPYLLAISPTSPELFRFLWLALMISMLVALIVMKIKVIKALHSRHHQQVSLKHLAKNIWQNHRSSLKLMPPYFINNLANAFPATLFLLFVTHALALKAEAGLFLMVYFLSGILALPFWFLLSKRIGKQTTWQLSMLLAMIGFIGVFGLNKGDFNGYLWICILTGLSLGADMALPASMQADIAQKLSQQVQNVSGFLFGLWGLLTKFALALAVGLSLPLLDALGLSEGNPQAIDGLWFFYAAIPLLLKSIAIYWLKTAKSI